VQSQKVKPPKASPELPLFQGRGTMEAIKLEAEAVMTNGG